MSKCLERRGNVKVLLYTLKPKFCTDTFMKMPKIGDLGLEYNLADSTIYTWKKNKDKIFQEAAEVGWD